MKGLKASDTTLCPHSSRVISSLTAYMHDNKVTTNIFKIEPVKFLDWFIKVCHICLRNCGQEKNQENSM